MKRIVFLACVISLFAIHTKASTGNSRKEKERSYINPFTAIMEYVAMSESNIPESLSLPSSWEYSNGKRCLAIGDNIVCIRRVPPRSAWKPSI